MNVYVLELAKQLAQLGHYVDVFTRSQDTENPPIVQVSDKFRVMHIPAGPQHGVPKKTLLQHIPEFVENVSIFCKTEKIEYDVMHCHYYMSGMAGVDLQKFFAAQGRTVPMFSTFHTLALMKNLVARGDELEDNIRIDIELELVKHSDMIIAPSRSDARYLVYLYDADPKRITVIPPGVDTSVFRPISKAKARAVVGASKNEKIVMFVGRIEPLKGIDMLMYAMKIVSKDDPKLPLKLYIVGGDISQDVSLWSTELQKLEKLCKMLRIPNLVKFVGQQPQHDLVYYYNAADIVVMPSHYESFGMAALEAMSCGVPVITTNVAGISGLIDNRTKSLITSVHNPLLLASQIRQVLNTPQTHSEISAELKKKVDTLEWKKVAEYVVNAYSACLK